MSEETKSTVRTVLITGLIALLGTVVGGVVKGLLDVQLAKEKLYSDLVIKALESDSPEERRASLDFMVRTNLIQNRNIKDGLSTYVRETKKDPSEIPQIKATFTVPPSPIIENARVYLLAGNDEKISMFNELQGDLAKAGFNVIGAKKLNDKGRPDQPEIRYFNYSDREQAENIAEFMRSRPSVLAIKAKQYNDPSARPGYIEIWLGR